ncbi:hypothetical protein B0H34DRAFT_671334 [Crassisporium funariophilum]|nr:hypothetical protein B0H34DRAFT_671334 [Crassisporium funariophilum]
MRSVAAILLSFVASTLAYTVLTPNGSNGWTNLGPQELTWQRVETDRLNFTVLLTNQKVQGYESQNLAALVDGTLGSQDMNPPSGGWPTGSGFRINLVQDNNNLNTILAQSPEFDIGEPTTSTTSGRTTRTTATATSTTNTNTNTLTGVSGPSDTPLLIPTGGALSSYSAQTGLLAFFSLLGFVLA